jgi:hypothetical protein
MRGWNGFSAGPFILFAVQIEWNVFRSIGCITLAMILSMGERLACYEH